MKNPGQIVINQKTVITAVGSGDSGKTSTLIALAYNLVSTGAKVTLVGFDPEEESALERLLQKTMDEGTYIPSTTISDLIKLKPAYSGDEQRAIIDAIDAATIKHPAGFGIIRCDESLIDHEVEGGDIYDLMRLLPNMNGVILIDCAAGSGGFSMLSALASADYVLGVAKPFPKSISIAKRACGLTPNKEGEFLPQLLSGIDEETGIKFGAKYLGMVGSMFSGARVDGNQTLIAPTGISNELRGYMADIMACPKFITHIPFLRGLDQRRVKAAHERIAMYVAGAIGLPCPTFK